MVEPHACDTKARDDVSGLEVWQLLNHVFSYRSTLVLVKALIEDRAVIDVVARIAQAPIVVRGTCSSARTAH